MIDIHAANLEETGRAVRMTQDRKDAVSRFCETLFLPGDDIA